MNQAAGRLYVQEEVGHDLWQPDPASVGVDVVEQAVKRPLRDDARPVLAVVAVRRNRGRAGSLCPRYGFRVPPRGAVLLPVEVQAVVRALRGVDHAVAILRDGRRGIRALVARDRLAAPGACAVLVPVELQAVAGGLDGDDRVAAGHRDRRRRVSRQRQRGRPPGPNAAAPERTTAAAPAAISILARGRAMIACLADLMAFTVPSFLMLLGAALRRGAAAPPGWCGLAGGPDWSGCGPFGVGGLDVLEEAAVHPEFLAGRRDHVPQA